MKVLIFGGFLGAGKTTVIMQMAKYMIAMDPDAMSKIVLLENEIGENGVDDKTLAETGMKVETLFSGCICCTMAGEMIENMCFIEKKFNPEWVILETTGMAYPRNVKKIVVDTFPKMEVHLISLVDAKRWNRMQRIPELKDFSKEQLKGADIILINKRDLVSEDDLSRVDISVRQMNNTALLIHISAKKRINNEIWKKIFSWGI